MRQKHGLFGSVRPACRSRKRGERTSACLGRLRHLRSCLGRRLFSVEALLGRCPALAAVGSGPDAETHRRFRGL